MMGLAHRKLEVVIAFELVLMLVIGVPLAGGGGRETRARHLASRLQIIESAATTCYLRQGTWPEGAMPGMRPRSLDGFLPRGFSFSDDGAKLAWDHCELGGEGPVGSEFTGISLTEDDPLVLRRVVEILGARRMHFTVGDRVTFLVDAPRLPGAVPGS